MDDAKTIIAKRIVQEIKPGNLVNLGIGLPTMVADYIEKDKEVFFQSENGIIGMGNRPPEGMEDKFLTDAGGSYITVMPGAVSFDSAVSFGLIRGKHLDLTVLGGLQVDSKGRLANWVIPGKLVPGMGGAMDLVTGAKKVIVAMQHKAKGKSKILKECTLPITSKRIVDLIVTDMAVIQPSPEGLILKEYAKGVTVDEIKEGTEAELIISDDIKEMVLN